MRLGGTVTVTKNVLTAVVVRRRRPWIVVLILIVVFIVIARTRVHERARRVMRVNGRWRKLHVEIFTALIGALARPRALGIV